ncbi:MAG: LytTR family transcriptional regulator [Ignavibacteria bacterium]|nr:LytTR family transcriptional regulator [Ignavibacteria bacterium]
MKKFEEILCRQQFIRIHKSHIINLAYLKNSQILKAVSHFWLMVQNWKYPEDA